MRPTVRDLEKFASIEDYIGQACLFPMKMCLHHHQDIAAWYRGILPFGAGVIEALKKIDLEHMPKGKSTYAEHIRLRDLTNKIASSRGMTAVAVNDDLYLMGMKLHQPDQPNTDSAE